MNKRMDRRMLSLYLVVGSGTCHNDPVRTVWTVVEALSAGVTMVQYREKGEGALTREERLRLGRELVKVCREWSVPLIVNDDVELALALDADGVHVGQDDRDAGEVRKRIGSSKILGVSAHDIGEAEQAIARGADYLGVGPMYPTSSKKDTRPVQGPEGLARIRARFPEIPLVGIGGITLANAYPVLEAGADGVAVISAICGASSPREAANGLKQIVSTYQAR